MNLDKKESYTYSCKNCESEIPNLTDFLRLDNLGIEDPSLNNHLTYDELKIDQILDKNTVYLEETRQYRTVLPWKDEPLKITNKHQALAAADRFAKKYYNDSLKWEQMNERIQFLLNNEFIELVPKCDMAKILAVFSCSEYAGKKGL